MTAIRDKLKSQYPRAVRREPPEGAFVVGGGATILSVDGIAAAGKQPEISGRRCDDLVVRAVGHDRTGVHVVERKTGSTDLAKIRGQLQGGVRFLDDFIGHHAELRGQRFVFEPVWVSGQSGVVNARVRRLASKLAEVKITSSLAGSRTIRHISAGGRLPRFRAA